MEVIRVPWTVEIEVQIAYIRSSTDVVDMELAIQVVGELGEDSAITEESCLESGAWNISSFHGLCDGIGIHR